MEKVMTDKMKGLFSQLTKKKKKKKKKKKTTLEGLHPSPDGCHSLQVGLDLEHSVPGVASSAKRSSVFSEATSMMEVWPWSSTLMLDMSKSG